MAISTYSEFQNLSKSEKIGLVVLEASKRLMGWVLHSGSIYKLTGFDYAVVSSIEDSGTAYTSVSSISACTASKYYNDRANKVLYLRASDSSSPNSRFLAMTFKLFFSNAPVIAPHDLGSGFDVEWLPYLKSSSDFGFSLDNQNQLGMAIEGSGTITLYNDQSFWIPLFDKVYFENQKCFIYSWNRELPIAEAKLIYRGRVEKKSYSLNAIQFGLKDLFNELRAPVPLSNIEDIAGARVPDGLLKAKQRSIYGYVFGHRPTNIDQVLDGYPITGTVSVSSGLATLEGTGTSFLSQLSPDDELTVGADDSHYTILDITSDTAATLTSNYAGTSTAGAIAKLKGARPKRWQNRSFVLSGHMLSEPSTTVISGVTTNLIQVESVEGFLAGDEIVIGSEISQILRVSGQYIKLTTVLNSIPINGTVVKRPTVTNVYLGERKLTLTRDYTYNASTGRLTLDYLAEFNIAPLKFLRGTLTFTNESRNVSATGSSFTADLKPGDWVRASNQSTYYEVLKITDDLNLVLRTISSYSATGQALAKTPEVYEEGKTVLSLDCLGATADGTTTGTLLSKGPQIVNDLLIRAGLFSYIDSASFTSASGIAEERLGLVIPAKFNDTKAPEVRDSINKVNQSIFGALIQNEDYQLQYQIFSPERTSSYLILKECDILKIAIESKSDNMVKTAIIEYLFKEYDPLTQGPSNSTAQKTSDNSNYLAKVTKEKYSPTLLVSSTDAIILANRSAFILEVASSVIKIDTKLQAARSKVTDPVLVEHEKMYQRIGSSTSRKVAMIESSRKSIFDSSIELEDLANAFTRCGCITTESSLEWNSAPESERILNGYITDDYGMMSNDPVTFGINLIW